MKKYAKSWKSSRKKKKQVVYRALAPSHLRRKMLSSHLSKELRQKYKRRSIALRKDDTVKVMTGEFKKKQGKVIRIDAKRYKVYVEGIQTTKKEGTKINVPFDPSNLQIISLNLDDKKRNEKLNLRIGK